MDYVYECKDITDNETIVYQGIDPMGTEEIARRAYRVLD